ncbi:DUF6284 family protein [Streptomyces albipurpureus]|uniref:DUF6284 family protein n=1 Tax=Streptomyces albipurpureus TaxID=2897419 RepID=A0ABT0USB1_9ACTN|nr:DUF6284 family protein [Streptomyces sp. CWNU-1]MCM2391335.1 DUF6284 family protein [Streptomyces sp. CWNU-1]
MNHITFHDAAIAFEPWLEPTPAELDAIERETPLTTARIELLDAQISVLDRPVTELDERRIRRARRRVLAARTALTNHAATAVSPTGGAA